ncbi:hypothetical protein HID58_015703 [Brassica napus]|uniref:Exocyst subunit Exo70 family protein n=2 Tax=Brassica napus TaxID=3708 RepID=A0ABQ8DNE9_BRANA|nr:hypothetical protein HID58_015703 [Brassica napus]CDY31722.1 BnaA04g16580D [Brassica napus]
MMLLFKPSTAHAKRSKPRPYQSFSESLLLDSIEATESFTKKWISQDHLSACSSCTLSSIFSTENRAEGRKFVDVINSLQYAIQGVTLVNPESHKLTRAHNLLSTAMKHLEKEFYRVLKSNRRNLDPESVSIRSIPSFNPRKKVSIYSNVPKSEEADIMTDLQMIADCMISSGYENECVRTYKKIRRSIIVDSLSKLGFENLSFGKIQKLDWDSMEKNIKKWLEATKIVINNLFDGERILCDHVFSTSPSVAESCFSEITLDSALTLFIFPVSVARCRKTAEKIFLTLDVYQTISNLLPRIEEIFSYDSTSAVRFQAADSLRSLGEAINYMVAEFEASIAKEASKSVIPGGGVHPLTRYVMNFVVFLADYNESLAGSDVGETASTVTTRLGWLILVLLCKIDTKSRIYENVALSYLFLANNLHYVISKVRKSNLRVVLGDEWVANHQGKVSQYLEKYEKVAWGEVLTSLSEEERVVLEEDVAKERLKRFNEVFEEAFRKQSGWVVPDTKMREGLKDSVAKKLTYVASLFYEKYHVETWGDIVRYVPKDLGNYLSDLYLGTGRTCIPSFKPTESGRSQLFQSGR